jgi:hypothetical protein
VVIRGAARFVVAGREVDAPAGTVIFVRRGVEREAHASAADSAVLVVGGRPGEAYRPSAWEFMFRANPHHEAKDYETARKIILEGLHVRPEHPALLFYLGCIHALEGDAEEAERLVRRAVKLEPAIREWVAEDDDLQSIRDRLVDA